MSANDKTEAAFDNEDDLFAGSLDDLADLASFEVPPPGAYICSVSTEVKDIGDKKAVEAKYTVIECVELEDKTPVEEGGPKPPQPGDTFSVPFFLGVAVSEGKMKQFLAPFAEAFGESGPGAIGRLIRDRIQDTTVSLTLKHRFAKEDKLKERAYADVRNITVA